MGADRRLLRHSAASDRVSARAGEKLVLHKLRYHPDFLVPIPFPCEGGRCLLPPSQGGERDRSLAASFRSPAQSPAGSAHAISAQGQIPASRAKQAGRPALTGAGKCHGNRPFRKIALLPHKLIPDRTPVMNTPFILRLSIVSKPGPNCQRLGISTLGEGCHERLPNERGWRVVQATITDRTSLCP